MEGSSSELERKVTRLARELDEARAEQAATSEVLRVISSSPGDLQPVFRTILANATRICEASFGNLTIREGDALRYVAAHGATSEWDEHARRNPLVHPGPNTALGRVMSTKKAVHIHDILDDQAYIERDPLRLATVSLLGARTVVAVPMLKDEDLIGTIAIHRQEVHPFTEKQIALLASFASQAVIAIENVRLLSELRARTHELEARTHELEARNGELAKALDQQTATSQILGVIASSPGDVRPVLAAIAENAARLCEAFDAVVRLKEESVLVFGAHYGPIPVDPKAWAISRKWTGGRSVVDCATIHVHDLAAAADEFPEGWAMAQRFGHRTTLAVPLLRESEAIGTIMVRRMEVKPFSEAQMSLLRTFADQAVIAIENARLFEEVRARNRELSESLEQQTATSAILSAIAASPTDIQPVLNAVAESAARLCDAYDTAIFLRRDDALAVAAHYGAIPIDFAELPLRRDVVTSWAVLDRAPVHVHDLPAAEDEYPTGSVLAQRLGFRTILATPLLRKGEAIGALMIRRAEMRPFAERQIALLKTFADQAVIAIENVRLFEEVQARNRDLTESLERQTAMSDILRVISRSPADVQPVFETIAESAARLCSAQFCSVFRFDGELIHFVAQHGWPTEAIEAQRRPFPMRPGRGSGASRAILSAAVEQIPDINTDPDYQLGETMQAINARSVLAVPMLRDGRPVGSINIGRPEPGAFPARQIELLQTFADQAVIAIENVRLFEEVQARTRELTESLERQTAASEILRVIARSPTDVQPVFDTIATSVAQLCAARYCIVFGFDGALVHFVAEHGLPPEAIAGNRQVYPMPPGRGSAAARAILSRTVEQIPDVEADPDFAHASITRRAGVRSLIAVPMLKDDVPAGAIVVARPQTGLFPERQIDLLRTFADQAVIAIENVRLFEEVQARTAEVTEALQQQTATADVLKVISRSAFDLDAVLQTLVDSAIRLCGADKGAITLREGDDLLFRAGAGQSPELRAYEQANPHRLGHGKFQGRAAIEGTTIHVPDVLADPEYERKETAALGIRAVLAVPLKRGAEVIGVFGLARATVGPFAPRQIELVESFADQAVIAIENARLFEEVQAKTRDLEESLTFQKATSGVLEVIGRSASNLQPVFDVILDTAADLCHADMSVLRLMRDGALLHVADSRRNDPAVVQHSRENPILPTDRSSVAGRVALARHTVHIPDLAKDEELTFLRPVDSPIGSLLGVPLIQDGNVAGVIVLLRRVAQPFTQRQIELVETFADQAVIAIENVRLFEEVQARTTELTESLEQQTATSEVLRVIASSPTTLKPVLQAVAESAARLCDAYDALLLLREGQSLVLGAHYGPLPLPFDFVYVPLERDWVAGRSVIDRETIQVADLAAAGDEFAAGREMSIRLGHRTVAASPLMRKGEAIGTIVLRRTEVRPFTTKQIDLLKTFADQAVIAIENVRLFEEVQAKTRDLEEALTFQRASGDVLEVIGRSASTLEPVLQAIVDTAADLCQADMSVVRLLRDGALHNAAWSKRNDPAIVSYAQDHPVRPTDRSSVAGRVALEKRTIHIADIAVDPEYSYLSSVVGTGVHSILGVPLFQDSEVIGVIALLRKAVNPFTERQIDLVQTFADQAVIAIENARLFKEVQQRTDDLSRSLEELRTAQDRLVQTEKLASLGQLTAGIAHEIKNPLNFVNNFSALSVELIDELREVLEKPSPGDEGRAQITELTATLAGNLEKVVQHGKRADSIVKNMLMHSRQGSGERRPANINALVEESLNLAYHGARAEKQGFTITLEKSLDPTAGDVDIFPQEITRVLLNLISNGFYATTKRGQATDGKPYEPTLLAATRNLGDRVEIRIRDNGSGIPRHVRERMFEPFFTTKPAGEGTGLGLSLSHDIIVKQHSGSIEVDTELGEFTEFRIVLPRSATKHGQSGGQA